MYNVFGSTGDTNPMGKLTLYQVSTAFVEWYVFILATNYGEERGFLGTVGGINVYLS